MKFLTNWKILIDKVPAYVELKQDFREQIDYQLANMILENDDERLTNETKASFRKMVERIDPLTNMLPVKYSPRFNLGRRYADCPKPTYPNGSPNADYKKYRGALISQSRIIKNTIFKYQDCICC